MYITRRITTCCLKQQHWYRQRAPKSPYTGPMGYCVSTFHTHWNPYNWSPKSINVHNWFMDNNTIDGHTSSPSLTSISDTVVRAVEKWIRRIYVVVFCILVKERVNSYRYSISWILDLYRQHWATTIRSRCASTPVSLSVYWTAALVF